MSNDSRNINLYAESEYFLKVYPNYEVDVLPDWVRENIGTAKVYGNSKQCVILSDGRKYHLKNKLNELNGKEWTFFINSVFSTHYPTRGKDSYAHNIRKIHPSPKPPQLMMDIISFFTKKNDLVLDSFMGVGGTLLGASLAGRRAIGFDLNPEFIETYKQAAEYLELDIFPTFAGDSLEMISDYEFMEKLFSNDKISLLLIDPPYSNMMNQPKTGAGVEKYGNNATPFTNSDKDLGNMSKENFLSKLKQSVEGIIPYLKTEGYVVIFIKDLQPKKKELNLLHYDVINTLNDISKLYYKGMKIWADKSSKLYPYGYPFSFVANQIHQYILVFRLEK